MPTVKKSKTQRCGRPAVLNNFPNTTNFAFRPQTGRDAHVE